MKIQSTSKKQASLMKAASVEPERQLEEDILSLMGEEDTDAEPLREGPAAINAAVGKKAAL